MTKAESSVLNSPLAIIVLAAGQGTRMRSTKAKVLHTVAGFPMITHVRRVCEALAPQRLVVVVAPGAEDVAGAVAPHGTVVQKDRLGTAHAVLAAREALQDFHGRVLIVYGDTPLLRVETLQKLATQGTPVSVLCFEAKDPAHYGRVFLNAEGLVERIVEHADANGEERAVTLCNAGVMAFESAVLWDILNAIKPHNAKGEYYLTDAVGLARLRGVACGHVLADADEVLGINSRVELADAEALMQKRLRRAVMEQGVTLLDPSSVYLCADTRLGRDVTVGPHVFFGVGVEVEEGVEIMPFCHLEAVHIKKGARIGPYARLRPGSVIGENAHIGNFVEIKKAQVEAGAKINHLSYIGDARVGARSNIGAGTITCNYDGYHKHHTDIGADVFVGSDTALVAPVKVGDRAIIAAGSVITDNVPEDAMAIARGEQNIKLDWAKRYREKKR